MARVTVEDCIDKVPNRYELLMIAAQRAKDISAGSPLMVDRDNDKNSVVALREIAEEKVSIEELQRSLVMGLQKYVEVEEPEEEELEIMAAERELSDLDEQFSGLLPQSEMEEAMQIHEGDEDVADFDADEEDEDAMAEEASFDDEAFGDDGFDGADDFEE